MTASSLRLRSPKLLIHRPHMETSVARQALPGRLRRAPVAITRTASLSLAHKLLSHLSLSRRIFMPATGSSAGRGDSRMHSMQPHLLQSAPRNMLWRSRARILCQAYTKPVSSQGAFNSRILKSIWTTCHGWCADVWDSTSLAGESLRTRLIGHQGIFRFPGMSAIMVRPRG